ncbi:MAG: hypothetical protein M3O87_06290 [Candidatus Dormibacteraeota bacterium]|nr:hypothetical protein [Candidatus Dormibacteraeota bacterium]
MADRHAEFIGAGEAPPLPEPSTTPDEWPPGVYGQQVIWTIGFAVFVGIVAGVLFLYWVGRLG